MLKYLLLFVGMFLILPSPAPQEASRKPRRYSCTGFVRNYETGELEPIDKVYIDKE